MARAREFRNICQKQFLAENRNAGYSGPHENPGSRPAVCGKEQRGARFDRIGVGSISGRASRKKFSPLNAGNPLKSQDSEERILGKERKNKTQIQGKARNGK
jgi:hypothetical protein